MRRLWVRASPRAKTVFVYFVFSAGSDYAMHKWLFSVSKPCSAQFACVTISTWKYQKHVPRVRIELTTFRFLFGQLGLWDWRAAYCATEAVVNQGSIRISVFQLTWVSGWKTKASILIVHYRTCSDIGSPTVVMKPRNQWCSNPSTVIYTA